ncbi:hypothetical protein [Desulfofustis limnaeus]|nr:hypothetical protein [Desulfofustis limnaeus]
MVVLAVIGCSEEEKNGTAADTSAGSSACLSCHALQLDEPHQMACTVCHAGNDQTQEGDEAHRNLIANPAAAEHAGQVCGGCHGTAVAMVATNDHYTLSGHLNTVRAAFGLPEQPPDPQALQAAADPATAAELLDDVLRRRCLRCHVYYQGDAYPAVRRGLGCAACHTQPQEFSAGNHSITKPQKDTVCLSCHYSNHVGFDYHGRYEHDFNQEYRTPYLAPTDIQPPYGVEYHQLEGDVHFQAGLVCVDCHDQSGVMGAAPPPSCTGCHEYESIAGRGSAAASPAAAQRIFTSSATGLQLPIPALRHPAHNVYRDKATCLACHARWTFNDGTTHLLRIDHDDLYDYFRLSVDGSSEVQRIIGSHIDFDGEWLDPVMTDKFTGDEMVGIWLQGYLERRWERFQLTRDKSGRITPGRPIVDLRLSWIDGDENVRFDNLQPVPEQPTLLPYAPHTVGPAGLFYEERLRRFEIDELSLRPEQIR